MTFITKNSAYIAIAAVVLAFGMFLVMPSLDLDDSASMPFISTAAAFGSSEDGGCCGNEDNESYNYESKNDDNEDKVRGCTDAAALNYNARANKDDGSCEYAPEPVLGCMDATALNYSADATEDDGSCEYAPDPILGCTDGQALNYNAEATEDNGSCEYPHTPEEPQAPQCPIHPKEGRTIVEFNKRLLSTSAAKAETSVKSVDLAPGTYTVELVSWDGYLGRENVTQPLEQWRIAFLSGSDQVAQSNSISDVKDKVVSDDVREIVNNALTIDTAVTGVQAKHVYVGKDKTPNSVNPICAAFDKEPEPEAPSCDLFTATPNTFANGTGGTVTLTWETANVDSVVIDNGVGIVTEDGSVEATVSADTLFTLTATGNGQTVSCDTNVTVTDETEIVAPECPYIPGDNLYVVTFDERIRSEQGESKARTAVKSTNIPAGTYTVSMASWDGYNGRENVTQPMEQWTAKLFSGTNLVAQSNEIADVPDQVRVGYVDGVANNALVVSELVDGVQAEHVFIGSGKTANSVNPICVAFEKEPEPEAPVCDSFTVTPNNFVGTGGDVTLAWQTTNTDQVTIDNGIGAVAEDGDITASITDTTTFTLTATGNGQTVSCDATVTITPETPAPSCDLFTANPNDFTNGTGGDVVLTWETSNVDSVSINNGVGIVAEDGTTTVNVSETITYVLTAAGAGGSTECPVTITVDEPQTTNLSCDSFTANPTRVNPGGTTFLTWETTDAVEVDINNGVGSVAVDGNVEVTVNDDTLFTLTATDQFGNTKQCDVNVDTDSGGGGGGGSSSPRCELTISDRTVTAGEEVTITWDNTRTNEMVIEDNRGNVIIDTEEDGSIDEDEGSVTVRPTRDTEYSMTVTRGSRDRVCRVNVEVEDEVTVIETRSQEPQVAGIALTSVPYTGFEAGPLLTFIFYFVLAIWAAFVAYLLVVRERSVMGVSLSSATPAQTTDSWETMVDQMHQNLENELKDDSVIAAEAVAEPTGYISPLAGAPANLPTGEAPVFGYEALNEVAAPVAEETLDPMTDLENVAHEAQALLSSDAINYFMETYADEKDRTAALQSIVADAKASFPTEGGWMVLNLDRVKELTHTKEATPGVAEVDFIPETRVGVSSLAEAVVTGNVAAAYDMIGHRPMFSLADAAADLDAVYRARKGMDATASDLLTKETANLSEGQLEEMIKALTSALDGAYDNEEAAVKMAVMKAIKASA